MENKKLRVYIGRFSPFHGGHAKTIATSINEILLRLRAKKISAENLVFGAGGSLLQHCDRDWLKFAQKGSSISINGVEKDLFKDPSTDPGKTSKKGRVETIKRNGEFISVRTSEIRADDGRIMREVFRDGELLIDEEFGTIKQRVIDNRIY